MATILIVDDELSMRELLSRVFTAREGYKVHVAESGNKALEMIHSHVYDLVLSDVKMPGLSGTELLAECRQASPDTMVILMTAYATIENAREAFKQGADDFVQKPFDIDEIRLVVSNVLEKSRLRKEVALLRRELSDRGRLQNIIGRSSSMQSIFRLIETIAMTTSTVLICGESGTGKELVARAIHACSTRANERFVSVNCGAFAETLLESELFGYMKGAFTGAVANKKGLFEYAHGGTLFLDEIAEMSLSMQVKLLRVLQERCIRRVGGAEEIPVDVRIVAATNSDLATLVEEGMFRKDLYYRVSVIPINLPPLRERREDIRELSNHFLEKYSKLTGKQIAGISREALVYLETYDWPGNVRELENVIERAVALETTSEICPERLTDIILKYTPTKIGPTSQLPSEGINLEELIKEIEKSYVLQALHRTGGNQTRASELLKMPVRSLRHLLDKHKIRQSVSLLREKSNHSINLGA